MNQFPIPRNYQDTLDMFSFILLGAPEFKGAPVKYSFTLDDVMEALQAGVAGVSSRSENPEAQVLFNQCREEICVTHNFFKEGKLSEAYRQIQVARELFKAGGKIAPQRRG